MSEGVGSSRTVAAASQTGPDDLAAGLNPHETELNPIRPSPSASRQSRSQAGFPRNGPQPAGTAAGKGRVRDHVACDPRRP